MRWGLLVISISLFGCATTSEVSPLGNGRYMVGAQVRGGFSSWTEVKQMSLKKAAEYCSSQGKEMVAEDLGTNGVRGWTPQESNLTFSCK